MSLPRNFESVPTLDLLTLIAAASKELIARMKTEPESNLVIVPRVNTTRRRMASNLRSGRRSGQEFKVTVFLAKKGVPVTNTQVTEYMHSIGQGGRSFFDHLNANADAGYAEVHRNPNGRGLTWRITSEGNAFVRSK